MQDKQSVYDKDGFFDLYQKLRSNPNSLNEIVEKPTMLGLVGGVSGKRILDLGCGCGEHLKLYLERGAAFVAGIDLSQAMLQQAAKNLAEFRPHFLLEQAPMERLEQLNEGGFDLITSSFAFHYVQDFPALLAKIYDKLKSNGQLMCGYLQRSSALNPKQSENSILRSVILSHRRLSNISCVSHRHIRRLHRQYSINPINY